MPPRLLRNPIYNVIEISVKARCVSLWPHSLFTQLPLSFTRCPLVHGSIFLSPSQAWKGLGSRRELSLTSTCLCSFMPSKSQAKLLDAIETPSFARCPAVTEPSVTGNHSCQAASRQTSCLIHSSSMTWEIRKSVSKHVRQEIALASKRIQYIQTKGHICYVLGFIECSRMYMRGLFQVLGFNDECGSKESVCIISLSVSKVKAKDTVNMSLQFCSLMLNSQHTWWENLIYLQIQRYI